MGIHYNISDEAILKIHAMPRKEFTVGGNSRTDNVWISLRFNQFWSCG